MILKTGSRVIICPKCRKVYSFTSANIVSKILEYPEGIEELGIECPNCEYFSHIAYLNDELKAMQKPEADRKTRRAYNRKFNKLQHWVERKLRNNGGLTTD